MPTWLNPVLHAVQSLAIVAGAVVLAVTHRIDWTVAASVIASLGGVWTGIGGALVTTGVSAAATTPKSGQVPPAVSPVPVDTPAAYPPGRAPTDAAT